MTICTNIDTTPRAFISCLSCHNSGRLVGDWFDDLGADEVTLTRVHGGAGNIFAGCEELWCMDHEGIPVRGEFGPLKAAQWGRVLHEMDEHIRPALCAWVLSGDYVAEGGTDLPSISDFEDAYCGEWDSFADYAQQLAEDIGFLSDVTDEIATYFHWDAWTRDLAFDYATATAAGGGVHVFRNL